MRNFPSRFISDVRTHAKKRSGVVVTKSGGRDRSFVAYDWGTDTFVFESGVWKSLRDRIPVLMVRKSTLMPGRDGWIMTFSTGSHSIAAIPLLKGVFWNLGRATDKTRSVIMREQVICSNIVGENIEISQREVDIEKIHLADEWLLGLGWSMANIVLVDRTDSAIEYYRKLGQEWRIKPLVWTPEGMNLVIASSKTHIHSSLVYYHNVKGVHFLTYPVFASLCDLLKSDGDRVREAIREIASPSQIGELPALLDVKYRHHHEVELFGIRDPEATVTIVNRILALAENLDGMDDTELGQNLLSLCDLFRSLLSFPELADDASPLFVSTMYKHLSGAIYSGAGDVLVPAFDDMKLALPGATYRGGKPDYHPGADARTHALLNFIESILSFNECIEYMNIYDIPGSLHTSLGQAYTRELDYTTNRNPVPMRLIEKRLAHHGEEYASFMLARVRAFKALGVEFPSHHLLARQEGSSRDTYYFVRTRCPGYPINAVSKSRLRRANKESGTLEAYADAILALCTKIGDAAAQTLIIKKYIPSSPACERIYFYRGKEVVEYSYDASHGIEMPMRVRLCALRGTLGWPYLEKTEENISNCFSLYMCEFAKALVEFFREHEATVSFDSLVNAFFEGFTARTLMIYWTYAGHREFFEQFNPQLRPVYKFKEKWNFALWALERQYEELAKLREVFVQSALELLRS